MSVEKWSCFTKRAASVSMVQVEAIVLFVCIGNFPDEPWYPSNVLVRCVSFEDSNDILKWRNDSLSIGMSVTQERVSEEQHATWFPTTINSSECVHLIGELVASDQKPHKVGVCRFDRTKSHEWRVSINMNPAFRGKGLSEKLLSHSVLFWVNHIDARNVILVAEIKKKNAASFRIFERNGFEPADSSADVIEMIRKLH